MPAYKPLLAAATHFTRRAARRRMSIISSVLIISLLFPIFLYFLLGNILANDPRLVPHTIRNAQNVLFITAHPDDGALYFGPSILQSLGRKNVNRYMLVLSSGAANPEKHKLETKASCTEYSIPDKKCLILQNKDLHAAPKSTWDESIIQRILERHISKWEIDLIITFDAAAFGDANHRALSNAVQRYTTLHEHRNPAAYALQTTSIFRRYLSLIDLATTALPFGFRILEAMVWGVPEGYQTPIEGKGVVPPPKDGDVYGDKALIVTDWRGHLQARAALEKHASAYSRDRALYASLGRYMWFNDLRRM